MELLIYALKVNLAFATLLAGYWLALRHETWFNARRLWLLLSASSGLILPSVLSTTSAFAPVTIALPVFDVRATTASSEPFNWSRSILIVYAIIATFLLVRFLVRTALTFRAMRRTVNEPCSFFGMVRIPARIAGDDAIAIHTHEAVHARQLHSIDLFLFEVLAALFWPVPIWRWALREVRLVHELAADAVARHHHPAYDRLILAHAMGTSTSMLSHRFGPSHVKARIAMLHNTRSPRLARRKLIWALPVLAFSIGIISWRIAPDPSAVDCTPDTVVAPAFPGGQDALLTYLDRSIRYPLYSKQHGYQGLVVIGFTVKGDGSIADAHVVKSVHADLDAEALRVVRSMPSWMPGSAGGTPQNIAFNLPIRFQLSSTDRFPDGPMTPKNDEGF